MIIDPIGLRLIHSALEEKKLFSDDYEFSADLQNIITFVDEYRIAYKAFPEKKIVEEKFGITFEDVQPFDYVSSVFLERQNKTNFEKLLQNQVDYFNKDDLKSAIQEAETFVKKFNKTQTSKCLSYKNSSDERFDRYLKIKKGELESGIKTPWEGLNNQIKCWANGTMNVVLAASELGKSWFLGICANHSSINNKKSLFISTEMAEHRIATRLDVLKFKIPFKDLRDSDLDYISEERYQKELIEYKNSTDADIIIAGKKLVSTVDDILKLISVYQPDIVYIDGGYRLKSKDNKKSVWENQNTVIKELQHAAEITNIPWIITSQLWDDDNAKNQTKFKRRDSVKYGKEWIIDPDVVLSLRQDEDMQHMNVMEIEPLKIRDGYKKGEKLIINWNTTEMNYTEFSSPTVGMDKLGDIKPENTIAF